MVGREVLACASELIGNLASKMYETGDEYQEEILNVCSQYTDNSTEIEELRDRVEELENERDDMIEELETEQQDIDFDSPFMSRWDDGLDYYLDYQVKHTEKIYNQLIADLESQKEDLESDQDEPDEAYEHWIISDWLGRQLKDQGEMVEDIHSLTIWGRCTTGQAIMLDHVICNIFDQTYDGKAWEHQA